MFTSWAVGKAPPNTGETIVWETVSDLAAGGVLKLDLYQQEDVASPGHSIGRFRLSYTTHNRSLFADGQGVGGDVSATWTVITPQSVVYTGGESFTILSDNSILVGGGSPGRPIYTFEGVAAVGGITGFCLEALLDSSLPSGGQVGPATATSISPSLLFPSTLALVVTCLRSLLTLRSSAFY